MKLDLTDCTFCIPVKFDHIDRKKNLDIVVCMLQRDFKTNIIIGEQGGEHFSYMSQWCKYVKFDYKEFHRTAMLNRMAEMCETPIFINYDSDVLTAPFQLYTAVEYIRNGEADFSYPYQYAFVRIPKSEHKKLLTSYDLACFAPIMNGADTVVRPSYGGAVIFNRDKFIEGGMENESFISYGPEDVERFERFTRLGYKCKRPKGHLYHLDHFVGVNSSAKNPYYQKGVEELQKERSMTTEQLKEYIKTWKS